MKALEITKTKTVRVIDHLSVPKLRPGYLLVRVVYVALNPYDAKNVFDEDAAKMSFGTDYSGIVEQTGQGYSKNWREGDKIFGVIMGANPLQPTDGAFAEYAVVKADVQYRMPDYMTFEAAATLGVGMGTAALGICHKLNLAVDIDDKNVAAITRNQHVFIYGGSTATATISMQLVRLNFDLVRSYGSAAAFDYRDPRCSQKISSWAGLNTKHAFDTISNSHSARICAEILSNDPESSYCSTLPLSGSFRKKAIVLKKLLL